MSSYPKVTVINYDAAGALETTVEVPENESDEGPWLDTNGAFGLHIPERDESADDDPACVCGVARSEHQLLGCPEGFQTAESWAAERAAINREARRLTDEDDSDRYYDPDAKIVEPEPSAEAPVGCFCGEPLNEQTWCGCTEGLRRLKGDDCDQGVNDEDRPAAFRALGYPAALDSYVGQLAETQEWASHERAMGRIFDTQ